MVDFVLGLGTGILVMLLLQLRFRHNRYVRLLTETSLILYGRRNLLAAMGVSMEVLKMQPANACGLELIHKVLENRSRIVSSSRMDDMLEASRLAVAGYPIDARANYDLGIILLDTNQQDAARRQFEYVLSLDDGGWAERAREILEHLP